MLLLRCKEICEKNHAEGILLSHVLLESNARPKMPSQNAAVPLQSYLVQGNPEHPFATSDLLRRAWNRVAGLIVRVQVYSSVVRVGHFLAFCIHDNSSTALVFWNTVPTCTKIEDL